MTQIGDDTHDDEIYGALLDMTSGLDGGMSAAVFRRELAKQGLVIVSVDERDRLAAENARLREALEAIDALEPMEINPSNYDHEDACELNGNAVQASIIARAALESRS